MTAAPPRTDPASFEARYRTEADPWHFADAPYERAKFAHTIEMLDRPIFARALELGCANGELTALLASYCRELVTLDAAPSAVGRARARLADRSWVDVREATIPEGLPPGPWDLVVASEILYYLGAELLEVTVARLVDDLVPGGRLLAVHWAGHADSHAASAEAVHARLRKDPRLRSQATEARPGYLLDLLERAE